MIAALISGLILAGGMFFVYSYYSIELEHAATDAGYAQETTAQLLKYLLIVSAAALALLALLIYSFFTTRTRARRMAYNLSKDISLSKEQFRRFYDLSPVPYLLITKHGTIDRPNKAFLRLAKLEQGDLQRKNLFSFISLPENPEKVAIFQEQASRHIAIEKKEVQFERSTGERRWVLLSIENLAARGTGQDYGLVTLVDIHEQKELERIKTEFLSLASHQLRAPLANLKWYIDFLLQRRKDQLNEEIAGYLKKMYTRNEDMIDLVNTLLNISRVEMGRIKVQKEETHVDELITSVVEELSPAAKEKELRMDAEVGVMPVFETDKRLLRIILQNLLSNAIRYTNNGGTVTVRAESGAHKIKIDVVDNGVGIPPEEQGKIFSKMYRAANAQAMEANGNGIGLYMCKALTESMGGTISFTSVLGKGTKFTIELTS